jgi:hypothetical protein
MTDPHYFIENAYLGEQVPFVRVEGPEAIDPVKLDQIPAGVVSGKTLIDHSAAPVLELRAGVTLALLFAERVATKAMQPGASQDAWFNAFKANMASLGFAVQGSAFTTQTFKAKGLFVHKAIIPFLQVALGGAAVGPIIIAALQNLSEVDKDKPWITLFDQQSRVFTTSETHFAAVSNGDTSTTIRHVAAQLDFAASETNVLFFKFKKNKVDFKSASTTMTIDNESLAKIEPQLRARMAVDVQNFISGGVI